jgi:DNA (cytosine-5)-methyltransferase 1
VRLEPHKDSCADEAGLRAYVAELRRRQPNRLLAADLFCGAGGISLGLERAGATVVFAVDNDPEAVETHRHHFGGLVTDYDLSDPDRVAAVGELLRDLKIDVIAGGPPCQPFSKAGRSMVRHRVRNGHADPHHERRDLWRAFLELVDLTRPRAVLMENVPDMALDREMFILRSMVEELESWGYAVEERVVDTWRYGVPQFRQRLILVALRDGVRFDWPSESADRVSVWNAIGDLPEVDGGWRPPGGADGYTTYDGPLTRFQMTMREGIPPKEAGRVYDHITRPVREDDARAFEIMTSRTRYSDLPKEFKRYRDDIFDDKYKRLDENDLSRTITAHIAKDGYWYIHPRQNRTITVREAARLQTFPDWFRCAGPPSAAFRQIGNAVPPLLAYRLGEALEQALLRGAPAPHDSRAVAQGLASWWRELQRPQIPWLAAETRWQVISAELLLDRAPTAQARLAWNALRQWRTPQESVEAVDQVRALARAMDRARRGERVLELARQLAPQPEQLNDDEGIRRLRELPEAVADVAILLVPAGSDDESEEPVLVTKGVLRVAARFGGKAVDRKNRLTDGRLAVARMIAGGRDGRDAHRALIELANGYCRPVDPECTECPLSSTCASSRRQEQRAARLF